MTHKERLTELLKTPEKASFVRKAGVSLSDTPEGITADFLLANGVIAPPVKIGDIIYVIPSEVNFDLNVLHKMRENNRVYEQPVDHITIWKNDYMLHTCDGLSAVRAGSYKTTWFLSRKEAEEKLREYEMNPNKWYE